MPSTYIENLYVEQSCLDLPYTQEIIERINLPFEIIKDRNIPYISDIPFPHNFTIGKKHLFLTTNRGSFYKPCPATREYQCCDYQVLNVGMNCPMDCVYCILQAYLNQPYISCFTNLNKMIEELDAGFVNEPDQFFRIGTGEFTDSLALDEFTGLSKILVNYMADKKRAVLELKTKSAVINNLKGLNHNGRTVVSWSLNSLPIMLSEEIRTATLEERLAAAKQCAEWGYKLAFHFDPIVEHPGWEEGYRQTIEKLFNTVPAEAIVWISMGALRYLPSLKPIATNRFKGSRIFYQEFIEGLDGKSRYFITQREKLYKHIYNLLAEKANSNTCIYFCMESDELWQKIIGFTPDQKGGLRKMLDRTI